MTSQPAYSRWLITSARPDAAAMCRGVLPCLSTMSRRLLSAAGGLAGAVCMPAGGGYIILEYATADNCPMIIRPYNQARQCLEGTDVQLEEAAVRQASCTKIYNTATDRLMPEIAPLLCCAPNRKLVEAAVSRGCVGCLCSPSLPPLLQVPGLLG